MTNALRLSRFNNGTFTTKDLCQLYRILDNIKESTNMAHQYLQHINKRDTAASSYINEFQEFLAAERIDIVGELRQRPGSDDADGQRRLGVIVQYEAWCEEFQKETVEEFMSSSLAKEAV